MPLKLITHLSDTASTRCFCHLVPHRDVFFLSFCVRCSQSRRIWFLGFCLESLSPLRMKCAVLCSVCPSSAKTEPYRQVHTHTHIPAVAEQFLTHSRTLTHKSTTALGGNYLSFLIKPYFSSRYHLVSVDDDYMITSPLLPFFCKPPYRLDLNCVL